jgi:hypothetical protein
MPDEKGSFATRKVTSVQLTDESLEAIDEIVEENMNWLKPSTGGAVSRGLAACVFPLILLGFFAALSGARSAPEQCAVAATSSTIMIGLYCFINMLR